MLPSIINNYKKEYNPQQGYNRNFSNQKNQSMSNEVRSKNKYEFFMKYEVKSRDQRLEKTKLKSLTNNMLPFSDECSKNKDGRRLAERRRLTKLTGSDKESKYKDACCPNNFLFENKSYLVN